MNEKTKHRRMEKNLSVMSQGSLDPTTIEETLPWIVELVFVLATKAAIAADRSIAVDASRVEAMMLLRRV